MAIDKNFLVDSKKSGLILNLKRLMQQHSLTEAEISRRTNIPQSTMHKILSGKTIDPRISTLQTLADLFQVSLDTLANDNPSLPERLQHINSVPVLDWKSCSDLNAISSLSPKNWEKWQPSELNDPKAFALTSKPSMNPRIPKGTKLIISPSTKPRDGDIILVLYKSTPETTLKEISFDAPKKYLINLNDEKEREALPKDTKIVGVVVESYFSYQ